MHAMAKMAKMAQNGQRAGDIQNVTNSQIWFQKWSLGEWRFWRKWQIWPKKWRKITRGLAISRMWQIFKLDAKSGPLESGDFGDLAKLVLKFRAKIKE